MLKYAHLESTRDKRMYLADQRALVQGDIGCTTSLHPFKAEENGIAERIITNSLQYATHIIIYLFILKK